jgi:hypothetical protein
MTLTTYNQTAIDVENVIGWWQALTPEAQADPANVDKLVETEDPGAQALRPGAVGPRSLSAA